MFSRSRNRQPFARTGRWLLPAVALLCSCGPITLRPDPSYRRREYPEAFDDRDWAVVLRENVRDGLVDYEHLKANGRALERFLVYISEVGPFTTPQQFRTPQERTAFWINAYNALVLRFVLEEWPTDTVYPLVGPSLEYDFAFPVDGRPMTLHDIEVRALRDSRDDIRVLFCLCKGAKGSPPLQDEPFRGADLPRRLTQTARDAMADRKLVRRNDEDQRLLLWRELLAREDEFIRYYERQQPSTGATLLNVLLYFSDADERRYLNAAVDYDMAVLPFDRALNRWQPTSNVENNASN